MVFGTLQVIDLKIGTLQATTRHGRETFSLHSREIPVLIENGPRGRIQDVPIGTRVLLRVSGSDEVVAVHVAPILRRVILDKMDPAAQTMLVQHGPRGSKETLAVAPNVQVLVDGLVKSLADVPAGQPIQLSLSSDLKTVLGIKVEQSRRTAQGDGPKVEGVLLELDRTRGVLTIRTHDSKIENFTVGPNVVVSLVDGRSNNLLHLVPGMKMTLTFDVDRHRVVHLVAEPTLKATLKSVDFNGGTIAVIDENDNPRSLRVDGKTTYHIHGWVSQLQDYPIGTRVHLVHDADLRVRAFWALSAPR